MILIAIKMLFFDNNKKTNATAVAQNEWQPQQESAAPLPDKEDG